MEHNDRPTTKDVYELVARVEDKVDRALEKMGERIDKLNFRYYAIVAGLLAFLGLTWSNRGF